MRKVRGSLCLHRDLKPRASPRVGRSTTRPSALARVARTSRSLLPASVLGLLIAVDSPPSPAPRDRRRLRAAPGSARFTDLYERNGPPSCRSTSRRSRGGHAAGCPNSSEDDPRLRVLPPLRPGAAAARPEREPEAQAVGSGFDRRKRRRGDTPIAHVVDGADEVTVRLSTSASSGAKVLGADKRTDVALLKIEARVCRR